MKRFFLFVNIAVILIFSSGTAAAQGGGVLSAGTPEEQKEKILGVLEDYTQKAVINELLKTNGEILDKFFKAAGQNVLPALAYQGTQQATIECTKQFDLQGIVQEAFSHSYAKARDQLEEGIAPEIIQSDIRKTIEEDISLILNEPVYQKIMEHYARETLKQQQKLLTQIAMQRAAQKAYAQQKVYEQVLRQRIQEVYKRAIQQQIQQAVIQQAVQQQVQQKVQEEVQKQIQQNIQQNIQRQLGR